MAVYLTKKEKHDVRVGWGVVGKGIVARRHFRPGSTIFRFAGMHITCYEEDPVSEKIRANTIRFDETWYVSPEGRLGDFLNHSCEPSVKIIKKDGKLLVAAIRPIGPGEEIVLDYSTILASDDSWQMHCRCGSAKCRGIVRSFNRLPKSLRERYIAENIVPKYILGI